jgi:UbiD family decarboxylase
MAANAPAAPEAAPVTLGPPPLDLRAWLAQVEQLGELHVIDAEVDPIEEMGGLTYLVGKQVGAPALLFTNVRGSPPGMRALFNLLGTSLPRVLLAFGLPPTLGAREAVQAVRGRIGNRLAPVMVAADAARVNEHLLVGDDVDLERLPVPQHWPQDGGRYIGTGDVVITRDPDLGHLNLGTYRMMLHDRNHVGLYLSPGKDARLHITRAWDRNQPVEMTASLGVHPLWMILGSQTFPKNLSELDAVGGILGTPLELVAGATTSLPLPARAEIAIEGVIQPHGTRHEGPFGEFTGYYGQPAGECPLVEVTALHYRTDPILTNALMSDYPSCEMALFYALTRSARLWDDLDKCGIPGIRGVWAVPEAASGFGIVVVSLQQQYAGHAAQVLALAAQAPSSAYFTKWIIAVDEDVDPTDMNQVLWAMSTRCSPVDDIDILRQTWSTGLDPSRNPPEVRPYGSKALINACKQHQFLAKFSRRTTLRRSVWEGLAARWSRDFGLPGAAPELPIYDAGAAPVVYHETAEFEPGPASAPPSM